MKRKIEKRVTQLQCRERERIKGGSEIGEEGGKSNRRFSFFSCLIIGKCFHFCFWFCYCCFFFLRNLFLFLIVKKNEWIFQRELIYVVAIFIN